MLACLRNLGLCLSVVQLPVLARLRVPCCRHACTLLAPAGPALAWCEEQRARLRKAKSKLEFKLRVQVRWPLACHVYKGGRGDTPARRLR